MWRPSYVEILVWSAPMIDLYTEKVVENVVLCELRIETQK